MIINFRLVLPANTWLPLTDGDKLEVNSEWYGQTVYFRPHNDSNDWNLTGTAVNVPAYTAVLRNNGSYGTGASGTKYKDAVVFLNPWVSVQDVCMQTLSTM